MRARSVFLVVMLAIAALAACAPTVSDATRPEKDVVGKTGFLTLTDVERRLRAAGFQPQRGGQVEQSFMEVPGALLRLPGAELQVFVYPDNAARARDTAPLDRVRVAPPTMRITWIMPPSLIEERNVAVIVLTRDEALRARIRQAITGG